MNRFPVENFGKDLSSRDRSILDNEVAEEAASSVANEKTKFIKYEQLQEDLDLIIEAYFPEEIKQYKRPSLREIFYSLAQSLNSMRGDAGESISVRTVEKLSDTRISLLMAAGAVFLESVSIMSSRKIASPRSDLSGIYIDPK
jgi:predicted dinucleotide-utilizing enzyme